jgi:hypothetical protein
MQMRDLRRYLLANPQVLVLLVICVVLGIGTFIAVLIGIVGSGSTSVSGDPTGSSLGIVHASVALLSAM